MGAYQFLNLELVFVELGGIALGGGAGNDKRRTGIIYEDGVDLVNYCVMVLPLDKILGVDCHVVTEVVEAEFIVGSESDVRVVCLASCMRVGFMFVNTVD